MKNKEDRDKWESKVQQQKKTIRLLINTLQKIVVMAERTCANDDDINMYTLDGIDRIRLAAMDAIEALKSERDLFRDTLKSIELQAQIMPHKWTFPNEVAAAVRKAMEGAVRMKNEEDRDKLERRYCRIRRNLERAKDYMDLLLLDRDDGEDVEDDIEAASDEIAALTKELNELEGERNQNGNA